MLKDIAYMVNIEELEEIGEATRRLFGGNQLYAYFHTREDALAWQEAKFGKKEEDIIEWDFDYKTYEIRKFNKSKEVIDTPFVGYKSESDCIAARDKWIWENVKLGFDEFIIVLNNHNLQDYKERTAKTLKQYFVEYIINKGGK